MKSRDTIPRPAVVALGLAAILLLQVALSWGRMGLPFLDGRLHHNYDNALFSTYARAGILLGDARSQLGVTQVRFESWGKPAGTPSYYTHHPFLLKALYQLWVRSFGDSEASSRTFALIVAMVAASGAVAALAIATGSVLAACLGTAVMVATPVFTIFQLCIKYELDGMAVATWLMAATFLALRRPGRAQMVAIACLAALAPLAHWTAILIVASLVAWLAAERVLGGAREVEKPLLALVAGAGLGSILLLATFVWLKGGWAPFWNDLTTVARIHQDTSMLRPGQWSERQRAFAVFNFPRACLWLAGLLAAAQALAWGVRRASRMTLGPSAAGRSLPAFFFCTLATAAIWVFGFPEASFIHNYMQIWFVLPLAALVTATLAAVRRKRWGLAVAVAAGVLAAWFSIGSLGLMRRIVGEQLGTMDEVSLLTSLRNETFDRFVFIQTRDDPLNRWFGGPIFEYYTARSVNRYDRSVTLGPRDKVLLLRSHEQPAMLAALDSLLEIHLVHEQCGARVCAYDVDRE